MNLPNEIKTEICVADFKSMLVKSVKDAGGAPNLDRLLGMTLNEFAQMYSTNGLRVVFDSERHSDAIAVDWRNRTNRERDGYDILEGNRG